MTSRPTHGLEPAVRNPFTLRARMVGNHRAAVDAFERRLREMGTTDQLLLQTIVGAFDVGYETAIRDVQVTHTTNPRN